jgi:TPR repeat protein
MAGVGRISCVRAAVAAALCIACADKPRGATEACIADSVGALHLLSSVPHCRSDDWACRLKCKAGDERSCLALGYAANSVPGDHDKARDFYEEACRLGAANGCTNCAATVWAGKSTDAELTCARRTFERACTAKEPFACGMVGRIMIESTTPPAYADGKRYLSAACDALGGFSCRVLARHLESGRLGDHPPEQVPSLLKRACATGDPDACGNHATAEETFQ